MKISRNTASAWAAAALAYALCLPVHSAPVIINGGFDVGFVGWTRADQTGSDGTFFLQTGTASPINAQPVPPPPQGATAAMTDAQGPGSHVLYQDFIVTAPVSSTFLRFALFIGNRADDFYAPNTLDFATPALNQQARVDILTSASDPFSVSTADVLQNLFQTEPGDPLVSGYTHYFVDVTALLNAHLNAPLRLRFAETDNVFMFQFGVDHVSFTSSPNATVDEPTSYVLVIAALLGLALARQATTSSLRGQPTH